MRCPDSHTAEGGRRGRAGPVTLLPILLVSLIAGCRSEHRVVYRPADLTDSTRLVERRDQQLATADQLEVFHDFAFTDRQPASGITFRHRIVDDAGLAYKMVHYDHGNGLAAADIDGDRFPDLYFVNQVGPNELWRNRGDGTFENVTNEAGVGLDSVVCVTASFADIDNDGDADLFVTAVRDGNFLFENDGSGRFTEISDAAGLKHPGHSSGAVFFDYDRDGLLDLFVTNVGRYTTGERVPVRGHLDLDSLGVAYAYYVGYGDSTMGRLIPERDEANVLYRNEGGRRFTDVTAETGVAGSGWSGDAIAWDVNQDGWQDLYVLNMNGNDEYYQNRNGAGFDLVTETYFRRTPFGSMGVATLDFDNDGLLDLYLTDMHSDMWETNRYISPVQEKERPGVLPIAPTPGSAPNILGNALFQNAGDGTFVDVAVDSGTETYWPWGASSGDLNSDGLTDLFVTASMNYPFRYAVNSVLLNDGSGSFVDSEFILAVEPRRENRMARLWFQLDCSASDHPICTETGTGGVVDVYGAVGSRTSVMLDLEHDDDLDIVTGEFNDVPMVLVSNLSDRSPDLSYAEIELVGTRSNRDALGAVVRLLADTLLQTRLNDGKSGYLSQSSLPLYFGLGDAGTIDRIEVTWPSGHTQTIDGPIATKRRLEIVEGLGVREP